jgi:3-hydroxyacyl-CoA dehydrogenase / enoyl-CoA hydratase / 3-hydroxybutyryl-CoA epimerase
MGQYFSQIIENGICVLAFNRQDKEANTLATPVLRELDSILDGLIKDPGVKGIVFASTKKDQFIAGADIEDIAGFKSAKEAETGSGAMQAIFQKIHTCGKPTVAAVHGACLGGGLELALACSWRIASSDEKTKLGLPEIQLGFIPGAGGTQRLPRLIGIAAALDLILTAKRVDGAKALKMGLVDACVPSGILRAEAIKLAGKPRPTSASITRTVAQLALEGNVFGRRIMAMKAKDAVTEKTKGFYPASYKALEAVFSGIETSLERGLALEAKFFGELSQTSESKALVHLFNATNAVKKHPYKEAGKERFADGLKVSSVGVIGGGFMGGGITTVCADRGIRVAVSDPSKDSLARLMKAARDFFYKKVKRRRLRTFQADSCLAQITPQVSPAGFNTLDVVIESVFEDLSLKQKILADLEKNCGPNWIFASNTSALPLKDIAAKSANPERVIGMHFFSPVEKMPLLEVVVTEKTAPWAVARIVELGSQMGKTIIIVKDSPGFYVNRALAFYLVEAAMMVAEGLAIDYLDDALTSFGWPVGPITLIDEVGLDIGTHVLKTMESAWPARFKTPAQFKQVSDSGRLGRKNSKGFYLYKDGKRDGVDQQVYSLMNVQPSRNLEREEIINRCVLGYINESILCLEDKVIPSPHEGDIGSVFGVGFPPFLGGPFKYVDVIGPKEIVARMRALEGKYGSRFAPAASLVKLADSGGKYYPEEG